MKVPVSLMSVIYTELLNAFVESEHPRDGDWKFTEGSGLSKKIDISFVKRSPDYIRPFNDTEEQKVKNIKKNMEENGWVGLPILGYDTGDGIIALTGSHRLQAAKELEIDVPIKLIGENDQDVDITNYTTEEGDDISQMNDTSEILQFLKEFGADEESQYIIDEEYKKENQ